MAVGCPTRAGAEEFAGQREAPNWHTPTRETGGAATPTQAAAGAQDQTVSFCPKLPRTGHCRRARGGFNPEILARLPPPSRHISLWASGASGHRGQGGSSAPSHRPPLTSASEALRRCQLRGWWCFSRLSSLTHAGFP